MILVRSVSGDGAGLAAHLERSGDPVTFCPRDRDALGMLHGLVSHVTSFPPHAPSLVIIDALGFAKEALHFRRRGIPVIGGNTLELWEEKRDLGLKIMEDHGLSLPESHEFKSVEETIRWLERTPGEFYFKPDGDVPKGLTRKGNSEWLIRFLHWARPQLTKSPRMVLQEPAPKGTELDVSVWLNGKEPIAAEVTIEEKKFLASNKGPSSGCQSNVVWEIPLTCQLVKLTIGPFISLLMRNGVVGNIGLNTIITPKLEVFGLEWTMRLGWDATQASLTTLPAETLFDQLHDLATGKLEGFNRRSPAGWTLRVSLPPQPIEHSKDDKTQRGFPLPEAVTSYGALWPEDVSLDLEGRPRSATGSGFLGVCVTTGTKVEAIRERLVASADALEIDDAMYRRDPVSRLEDALKFTREHKLCPDPFSDLASAKQGAKL